MNSVTVDELVMRIEIELDKFRSEAAQAESIEKRLRKSLKDTERSARDTGEGFDDLAAQVKGSSKATEDQAKQLVSVIRRFSGFITALGGTVAVQKFTQSISRANDQLGFLSKRLGLAARDVKALDTALSSLGGEGALATVRSLNQGIQEMVITGNDSLIPFFGALGVGVTDAAGNIRDMDDILLDMADSLSRMDPQRAYAIASAMGLDDGMANALIQGRDAMQEMMDMHNSMYVSTQAEIQASRELNRAQAFLSAQWDGIKTIIGNALIPHVLRLTKLVSGWVEYLHRNESTVRNFFDGLSIALSVVLIPLLVKASLAMLAFMSPVLATVAAVGLLSLGFAALYDDYKTWSEGGKSLFDWTNFVQYINDAEFSVDGLAKGFAYLLTGYESWAKAGNGLYDWAKSKGLIDENGLAIRNLGTAIKEMAKDAVQSMPLLQAMIETIALMLEGRWTDAAKRAMDIPGLALKAGYDLSGAVGERIGGAIDTAVGIDPSSDGSMAGTIRRVRKLGGEKLQGIFGSGDESLESKLADAERSAGLPAGLMSAILMQETGGSQEYIKDPSKYHYGLNAAGKRIDPHTGKVSTAFGPFGILESTGRDPGYGVSPLANKTLEEQIRFASEYIAARIKYAGGLREGLAGYGEGFPYADSVMGRMGNNKVYGGKPGAAISNWMQSVRQPTGASAGVEVNIGSVTVQTSATTLPDATADGVAAGVKRGNDLLDQMAGGLR